MRAILAAFLMAQSLSLPVGAAQAAKACSILTKDLVLPFTENPKVLDFVPAEEEPFGNGGTACDYGPVRLQLYPPRTSPSKTPPKDFQALTGAGELAYFRSNRNRYAELMVWGGVHYFTLQVSVPSGSTAEAIRPKTVALANHIIAKLK
jgi:hypothetical protein